MLDDRDDDDDDDDDDDVLRRTHYFGTDASRLPHMILEFCVVDFDTVLCFLWRF